MIVLENDLQANAKLMQIIDAMNALRLCLDSGEGRQKQGRKNSHNPNNNKQLDQTKAASIPSAHVE
jgi:hypothetical protein